jgi:protein Mpv17
LTSGTLSSAGDVLAQLLVKWKLERDASNIKAYEYERTLRMFGFGFVLYGPFQHWWYGRLATAFPGSTWRSFLSKVTLNQVLLGPIVLTSAFAWNLCFLGQLSALANKIERDLVPTMINGWKFWVPAACVNFKLIPLQHQVLYMSVCGILWTSYISFASYNSANAIVVEDS